MTLLALSLREIWNSKRRILFPFLCLSLAVASTIAIKAAEWQVEIFFNQEGQKQLGGDLSIEGLRPLADSEIAEIQNLIGSQVRTTSVVDFNTMLQITSSSQTQFVRAFFIDTEFPLVGQYQLEPPDLQLKDLQTNRPSIVLPLDFMGTFGIQRGDRVKVGQTVFEVIGFVAQTPSSVVQGFRFAPRVFIHQQHLAATGLLDRPGRVDYERFFSLSQATLPQIRELKAKLTDLLKDRDLRITTFEEANRGFQRVFDQMRRFAEIVGLAAVLIVGFALLGTFRTWFFERRTLIALLRTMGADRRSLGLFLLTALFVPIVGGALIGLLLGLQAQSLMFPLLQDFLNVKEFRPLPAVQLIEPLAVCLILPMAMGLSSILAALRYRPLLLIKSDDVSPLPFKTLFVFGIFLYVLLVAMMALSLQNLTWGAIIPVILLALLFVGSQISMGALALVQRLQKSSSILRTYGYRSALREAIPTRVHLSLVFLVALVFSILFVLEAGLRDEFRADPQSRESSLFVFDVGEEEKAKVSQIISTQSEATVIWAPWVRVQWKGVNGKSLESLVGEDERFEREMFVSESVELPPGNEVIRGRFWSSPYQEGVVEVSLSRDYAQNKGITIGDTMQFELFGVSFDAVVTNFRKVRWTEFEPNFRFLLQGGFFEGVPFNYLGAVQTETKDQRLDVIKIFERELPALSVLDVSEIKKDLVSLTQRLSDFLKLIVSFLIVLGLGLMAALAYEKVVRRRSEIATLKCLGASPREVLFLFGFELTLLSVIPSLLGSLAGLGLGHIILFRYLSLDGLYLPTEALVMTPGLPLLMLIAGLLSLRPVLHVRPRVLFVDH